MANGSVLVAELPENACETGPGAHVGAGFKESPRNGLHIP